MHFLAKLLVAPLIFILSVAGYSVTTKTSQNEANSIVKSLNDEISALHEQLQRKEILGAQNAVAGEKYFLSGSGVTASQTSVDLTKFGFTRPDGVYHKFIMADFGEKGCLTIEPDTTKKREFASFAGVTQNSDGTAQLTGVTRGLERTQSFNASTTLQTAHAGGATVVLSNDPGCFYQAFANKKNDQSVGGIWTFFTPPIATTTATSSSQFITKGYADALSIVGAPTSTFTGMGVSQLADLVGQLGGGIGTSTQGRPLVVSSGFGTSSPYSLSLFRQGGYFPVGSTTDLLGQISRWHLPTSTLAGEVRWDNAHYFNAPTTTVGNIEATSTGFRINGVNFNYSTLTSQPASSTSLVYDANGRAYAGTPKRETLISFQPQGTTGNQTITHNLGRLPQNLAIHANAVIAQTRGGNIFCGVGHSDGFATSTAGTSQYSSWVSDGHNNTSGDFTFASTSSGRIVYMENANGGGNGIDKEGQLTSMTATTIIINWITNNSAASGCMGNSNVNMAIELW